MELFKQYAQQIHAVREDLEVIERIMDKLSGETEAIQPKTDGLQRIIAESVTEPCKAAKEKQPEKKETDHKGGRRITVDRGKILALWRANWGTQDIARDVNCSVSTVKRVLAEEREAGTKVDPEELVEVLDSNENM